jgi:subtilisin family serine protease
VKEAAINQSKIIFDQDPTVGSVSQSIKQTAHQSPPQIVPNGVNRIDADLSAPPARSGDKVDSVDADIAILDCGVDPHDDINLLKDREVSAVIGKTPRDGNGHGTHVAGIAAAKDNEIGVVGTAPGARIWNVKVLDYDPAENTCTTDTATMLRGLQYVAEHADEIEVVNLSLGGKCEITLPRCLDPNYENAINNLINRGLVVIASAGNSNDTATKYVPARFQGVITVANVVDSDGKCGGLGKPTHRGPDDALASNSNYGPTIDVASPGVNILSTYLNNSYARLSGTSMAAPHVAGEAAYFMSINPLASPSDVRNEITASGAGSTTICDDNGFGYFKGDRDMYPEPLINEKSITTTTAIS